MTLAILVVVLLAVAFALGPRAAAETALTFDPLAIGPDPEAYLAKREAATTGIRPGLQEEIVWADAASKAPTRIAIVYVHGFSASKGEVRPLPDRVAEALHANLHFTRLTGHGQDGAAMARGSVNAWVNDYAEAIAIGRALGERVVVIGTSTGAALATWASAEPRLARDVAALVLLSPNYGLQAAGSRLLTLPWGAQLARLLIGRERGFEPLNAMNAALWTTRYPTDALLPLAALTRLAREAPVETIRIPALFLFCDRDRVVRPELTRAVAARWGAPHELAAVERCDDPYSHVLAGDAMSPSTTDALVERIVEWIRRTVG